LDKAPKHECVPLPSRVQLHRQEYLPGFWSIEYEVFEYAVDGICREDGVVVDVGVTVFQAGAADRDRRFKESGIFIGNGGLCCGYIHLDAAG
jgi:hypothetical protein